MPSCSGRDSSARDQDSSVPRSGRRLRQSHGGSPSAPPRESRVTTSEKSPRPVPPGRPPSRPQAVAPLLAQLGNRPSPDVYRPRRHRGELRACTDALAPFGNSSSPRSKRADLHVRDFTVWARDQAIADKAGSSRPFSYGLSRPQPRPRDGPHTRACARDLIATFSDNYLAAHRGRRRLRPSDADS